MVAVGHILYIAYRVFVEHAPAAHTVISNALVTMLKFRGCQNFRQRLLLSTISGRAIRIDDIRSQDENPGLRNFEASFLRLLEKLTNGCAVEINETGTFDGSRRHSCFVNQTAACMELAETDMFYSFA